MDYLKTNFPSQPEATKYPDSLQPSLYQPIFEQEVNGSEQAHPSRLFTFLLYFRAVDGGLCEGREACGELGVGVGEPCRGEGKKVREARPERLQKVVKFVVMQLFFKLWLTRWKRIVFLRDYKRYTETKDQPTSLGSRRRYQNHF
ncbi:hypothetical protein HF086_006372 [Spodoptera exigua]|uniref:Uncharacterized protein n=1 Tax=Spodoptera exigua TaxID=7107 RepID=A0A922SF65_SPOEX|nr:hypothetical protein HF086_006372 [Spodoptera exigua]